MSAKPRKTEQPSPRSRLKVSRWLWLFFALPVGGWIVYQVRNPTPLLPLLPAHSDPLVAQQIVEAGKKVQNTPRSGRAWGGLGMVLHAYLYDDLARYCFTNAEKFDAKEPRWPYFQGTLLLANDPSAGIAKLARAAELAPLTPDTPRLQLARALFEQGQLAQAEEQYKQLLSENRGHAPAILGLARVSHARGDLQQAAEYLKSCLESPYAARSAYLLLATIEQRLGNQLAAQAAIEKAAKLPPDQSWPEPYTDEIVQLRRGLHDLVNQADQALKRQDYATAEAIIAQLLKNYPQAPESWLLSGRLRLEMKDCTGAEQALRRHLQIVPDSVNGNAQLGASLLCLERYPEAAEYFEKNVRLKPDFGEGHFNLGFARARAGQGTQAISAFRDAIRCSPNHIDSYILLGDLLSQSGQSAEAAVVLNQALKLNPNDDRAKFLLNRAQSPP